MESHPIQWHPGFYAGMELEFRSYQVSFESEYQLTKGPLVIDLLIIKKLTDEVIDNEIGNLFRRHNIVEYKSPEDSLNIDVFYKTQAYACLYKASGETVDAIPADEITVTLCRDTAPSELFCHLKDRGFSVSAIFPGVYYLEGAGLFPTQVIVTSELQSSGHLFLKILSNNVKEEDVRAFLRSVNTLTAQGDLARVDAVLQVSTSANTEMYRRIYKEGPEMCQALREIMKEDFDAVEAKGEARGTIIGTVNTYRELGFTNNEILSRIMKKFSLTQAEAESYVLASA